MFCFCIADVRPGLRNLLWCNNAGVGNEILENVSAKCPKQRGMVLPFQPLSITFTEIRYAVDIPQVSSARVFSGARMLRALFLI